MELKQIKELIARWRRQALKRLRIKDKDKYEIELEQQDEIAPHAPAVTYVQPAHPDIHSKFQAHPPAPYEDQCITKNLSKAAEGRYITSPMVGTFYHSPSPEDPAFVKVGDRVDENTVVCIIEAMKVMNEVKAG